MQGLLLCTTTLGSRALSAALASRCITLAGSFQSTASHTAQSLSTCAAATPASAGISGVAGTRALHSSASVSATNAQGPTAVHSSASSTLATTPSSTSPATLDIHRQHHLHHDGTRTADPGEPRYTAPYWVPPAARAGVPAVLFTDPWPSHDEPQLRRHHAALCLDSLRRAGGPLTAQQVHDAVNAQHEQQQGYEASSGSSDAPATPVLASLAYTKQLVEHLRRTRFLFGRKNPTSLLSSGHPDHPRLYEAQPYQLTRYGKPEQLAAKDEAARAAAVQHALKRLRNGKPPYAIHRRRAHFSMWQHAQAQEALRELQQQS